MQWSRRFIGLKVFMTLAELGARGVEAEIRQQTRMGRCCASCSAPRAGPWSTTRRCLWSASATRSGPSGERVPQLLKAAVAGGEVRLSVVRQASGESALRACITNVNTREADVHTLVAALERARAGLHFDLMAAR